MVEVIASGTVRVRDLDTGREWDEIVVVRECDLQDTDGEELAVEDVARRVANLQSDPAIVETLEVDLS